MEGGEDAVLNLQSTDEWYFLRCASQGWLATRKSNLSLQWLLDATFLRKEDSRYKEKSLEEKKYIHGFPDASSVITPF